MLANTQDYAQYDLTILPEEVKPLFIQTSFKFVYALASVSISLTDFWMQFSLCDSCSRFTHDPLATFSWGAVWILSMPKYACIGMRPKSFFSERKNKKLLFNSTSVSSSQASIWRNAHEKHMSVAQTYKACSASKIWYFMILIKIGWKIFMDVDGFADVRPL